MWFCFLIWETWQFCPLLEHTARITWRQREELTLNHVCVFSLVYVFVLGLGWNMDVAENGLYTSLHQNSHSFKIVKGKLMTGGTMGIPFLLGPSPPWHIAQVTARYQSKQSKNPPALLQQACLVCLGGAG